MLLQHLPMDLPLLYLLMAMAQSWLPTKYLSE